MKPEDLIFPIEPNLNAAEVLHRLQQSAVSRDSGEIERALTAAHQVGLKVEFVPVLIKLLYFPNHISHEDIVSALQSLKDPRPVEVLYRTALKSYEYLNYDEFNGLARKCTWALADIGTAEAFAKLQTLAASENSTIAGYAKKRLDAWEDERSRKGI